MLNLETIPFLSVPKSNPLKTKINHVTDYLNIIQAFLKSSFFKYGNKTEIFYDTVQNRWKFRKDFVMAQYCLISSVCLEINNQGFVLFSFWKAKIISYIKIILTIVRLRSVK